MTLYFYGKDTQHLNGLNKKHLLYFHPHPNNINIKVEEFNIRLKTCLFKEFNIQEREEEKEIMV